MNVCMVPTFEPILHCSDAILTLEKKTELVKDWQLRYGEMKAKDEFQLNLVIGAIK